MRLKIFNTPKPKRFKLHTRYYNENALATEDAPTLERGSFRKYRGRFDSKFQTEEDEHVVVRSSNKLIRSMLIVTLIGVGVLSYFYVKGGWIITTAILALIFAFAKRK